MLARLCLVCGWLLAACSGAEATPVSALAPKCGGEPTFDAPAPALENVELRLAVSVTVPSETLEQALERAVPRTLAHAKGQSMGAPGKVTYHVQRGPLAVVPSANALAVHTQLFADIDVCKPLGPICLHYGACRPEWSARVTVPLDVDLDAPPNPRLELALTKGCVLRPVGYDATPELEKITQDQARGARAQVQRRIGEGYEQWLSGLTLARDGIRLGPSGDECVSIEPTALERTQLREAGGDLSLAVALNAEAEWGCPGRPRLEPYEGGATELPRMEVVDDLDGDTRIVIAEEVPYEALAKRLAAPKGTVQFRAGMIAGERRLFAGVSGVSDCDPEWVVVEPSLEGDSLKLVPVAIEGAPGQGARWLSEHGRVSLSAAATKLIARSAEFEERWRSDANQSLADVGLAIAGPLERFAHHEPGPDRLRLGIRLVGQLRVAPQVVER